MNVPHEYTTMINIPYSYPLRLILHLDIKISHINIHSYELYIYFIQFGLTSSETMDYSCNNNDKIIHPIVHSDIHWGINPIHPKINLCNNVYIYIYYTYVYVHKRFTFIPYKSNILVTFIGQYHAYSITLYDILIFILLLIIIHECSYHQPLVIQQL